MTRVAAPILATALTAAALAGPAHATHTTAWKAPTEGAVVSGILQGAQCEATSTSPLGVERVEFYVDGALHNTERNAPYNCHDLDTTKLTEGLHVFRARGVTKGGAVSEHSIDVTVDNVPDAPSPTPPSPAPSSGAGQVNYMRIFNYFMDPYLPTPPDSQKQWMNDHYDRGLVYSPSFDGDTSWFTRGWVYHDAYAIYTSSATATSNPDWILKDASGNKLYIPYECDGTKCSQYAGDFGNPAFRQHIIDEIKAKLARGNYKGIFFDDVNMEWRVSDGSGNHVKPIDPRTGAQMTLADWRRYFAEFTEQVDQAFPDKEITHNPLWWTLGTNDPYVDRQAAAADYLSFERGVNDSGLTGGTTGTYSYLRLLSQAERYKVIFESGVRSPDEPALEYGLASYFLVNDGRDLVSNHRWRGTPDDWWSAGYDVDLGAPLGPRYSWNGLLRRDFERGIALVNQPGTSTRTVALPETYLDLDGNPQTSVTLAPARGTVLRKR